MCMRARLSILLLLIARPLIPVLCVFLHGAAAWAAPTATAPHLTVQLVVPPAQIYPGQSFTAGLYFKLDPGWHVYWINAGDSGEPPSIKWTLPAGITADAIQFPAPKRLPLGPLMDYGYENEVLFPIPMHVAADFKPSRSTATLAAKVNWLVCREVCIPGKAQLSVERHRAGKSRPLPPPRTPRCAADGEIQRHAAAAASRRRCGEVSPLR